MAKKPKKKRREPFYTGDLARPITIKSRLKNLDDLAAQFLHWDELAPIYEEKLRALGTRYGFRVDTEEGLLALVLAMARRHVPGFKLAHLPGREVEWTPERKRDLYAKVRQIQADHNLTIDKALEKLETGSDFSPVTAARLLDVFKQARREHNQLENEADALLAQLASRKTDDSSGA